MEIIQMFIDERDDESGIDAISVVDQPAIELDFIALNKQTKVQLVEVDEDKNILMGAILVPNKPIYRNQDGKEFYIYFNKKTVRKGMELFFKKGNQNNATQQHQTKLMGCTLVESWIKEDEVHDKSVKYGLSAPVGSWIGTLKVDDKETYQKAKNGELKGFSIEGYFTDKLIMKKDENKTEKPTKRLLDMNGTLKTIMEKIKGKPKEVKLEEIKSADGSVTFDAIAFEEGQPVTFMTDGENIPVPVGEYELENGAMLVVAEEGIIASYNMGGEEEAQPEEEQEMEEEKSTAKKIVESVTKETHFNEDKKEETVHVEFTDAHKEAIKALFVEFMEEMKPQEEVKKEVKEELSKVKPIKHSPEKKTKTVLQEVTAKTRKGRLTEFLNNK